MNCPRCEQDYPSEYYFATPAICITCFEALAPREQEQLRAEFRAAHPPRQLPAVRWRAVVAGILLILAVPLFLGATSGDPANPSLLGIVLGVLALLSAVLCFVDPWGLPVRVLLVIAVLLPLLLAVSVITKVGGLTMSLWLGGGGLLASLLGLILRASGAPAEDRSSPYLCAE